MRRLKKSLERFSFFLTEEIPLCEFSLQRHFAEWELDYYERIFRGDAGKFASVLEAYDAIDFIITYERDESMYHSWGRLGDLYRSAAKFIDEKTGQFIDPNYNDDRYKPRRVAERYKAKSELLEAYARRCGVIVIK